MLGKGAEVAFAIGRGHAAHIALLKHTLLCPRQHLPIDIGAPNLMGAIGRQFMEQDGKAIGFRTVGAACTPDFQAVAAPQSLGQDLSRE